MSAKLSAMLDPALAYAASGFYVFPLGPRSKIPLPGSAGFKDASRDEEQIRRWFAATPDANVAIACAMSGILAVDVDRHRDPATGEIIDGFATLADHEERYGKLPETITAQTGGGGMHRFYVAPAGAQFRTILGPGLEIKHQGYVVAPDSIHPDTGERYRWVLPPSARMPAELPAAWLAIMVKPAPKAITTTTTARTTAGCTPYGAKAKRDEIEELATKVKPGRNNLANEVALKLARLHAGGEIEDCREEIFAACVQNGLVGEDKEHAVRATIESGWRRGMSEPRTAPARDRAPARQQGAAVTVAPAEWPEPQPLVADLAPIPYPIDTMPPLFRDAIVEVQGFVRAPMALVAQSALAAASVAVQGLYDVQRVPGLVGPTSLFLNGLAYSGERKTSCDGHFSEPICAFELDEASRAKPIVAAYQADLATWEAQRRALESRIEKSARDNKPTDEDRDRLREHMATPPKPPRVPVLSMQDTTTEALANRLGREWPSTSIQSSEGGAVFGAHSMGKDSLMRNLALYDTLWDGKSMRIDRRGSGPLWVKNARLTLSVQVQPGVLRDFLDGDRGLSRESGFLARVLWAHPESTQGTRLHVPAPAGWPARTAFNCVTTELLHRRPQLDDDGGLIPETLVLSPEARAKWIAFHDRVELELGIAGSLGDVRDVAAKIADNAARLAAIFHAYAECHNRNNRNNRSSKEIGPKQTEEGLSLSFYYLHEARRILGALAVPDELAEAAALDAWLVSYCKAQGVASVPVSTIQKAGPGKLRSKAALEAAVRELEDLGRARMATGPGKARGVAVNPGVLAVAVIAVPAVIAQPARKAVI